MGRIKRPKSISRIFIHYIVCFIILIPIEAIIISLGFLVCLSTGLFLPANYYEQIVEKNRQEIESVDVEDIKEFIPNRCVYGVFDVNGRVITSNVDSNEESELLEIIRGGKQSGYGRYYKIISRENETCIVGYTLSNTYRNEILNKLLPNPTIITIAIFTGIFIMQIVLFSKHFAKRLSKEMDILNETTRNITMDNLAFDVGHSNITEINNVLDTLLKMRDELSKSLQSQWKKDDERKRQLGALAHDIKTPLTIIRGNSELLNECDLNEVQSEFNKNILNEVLVIERYVQYLIEIMQHNKEIKIKNEEIYLEEFIEEIVNIAKCISREKKLEVITDINEMPKFIIGDKECLKRAVINVISNAVDYSNEGTSIKLSAECLGDELIITIEDNGRGFTNEELEYATEEFFRGDKSRTNNNHYGIGLFIAKSLVEKHNGDIVLSNSTDLEGAKVEIKLPKYRNK